MIFDKKAFKKNASAAVKKLLTSDHLDVLDGMEVKFDGEFGTIDEYWVGGEAWELYPVEKGWCKSENID